MKIVNQFNSLALELVAETIDSPVGQLTLVASSTHLHAILWDNESQHFALKNETQQWGDPSKNTILAHTLAQLTEYFEGKRQQFSVPLFPIGTAFQQQAWQALLTIPYASTISYREQAAKLGDKNKARAVGMANSRNPIPIIIPCHRVIGSNGKLVGFGGGMDKKAYLLELERQSDQRILV